MQSQVFVLEIFFFHLTLHFRFLQCKILHAFNIKLSTVISQPQTLTGQNFGAQMSMDIEDL